MLISVYQYSYINQGFQTLHKLPSLTIVILTALDLRAKFSAHDNIYDGPNNL